MPKIIHTKMRKLRAHSEWFRSKADPGIGIPVGGAHIDWLCKAEACDEILRSLRKDLSLEGTKDNAIKAYCFVIDRWNSNREWQVHRSTCGAEGFVIHIMKRFNLV